MNSFLELASTRRSIRKFIDRDISDEDIKYFIKAAVSAPSGCNSQCWRFVAIRDKEVIGRIETAVMEKLENILKIKGSELPESYMISKRKMVGFFTKAPVSIAVFMTKAEHYDSVLLSALKEHGYNDRNIMDMYANFDILSVGAAVQNMLLAIHEKGYGACWMNDPTIAGEEINKILGIPLEERFISLIPIGFPAYSPRNKQMKDLDKVFSLR